jgi:hypothetical protein
MSSIPEKQNQQDALKMLDASSQFYGEAKVFLGISMILSGPVPLVTSIITAFLPAFQVYTAFIGVISTLLITLLLVPAQKELQRQAAGVQQLFDYKLFDITDIDLRSSEINRLPGSEIINGAASKYRSKTGSSSSQKDWYPVVIGQLPLHLARLICQRTNCWWDNDLRRKYLEWIKKALLGLTVVVFLIGLIGAFSLEKLILAVIIPLSPALILGINHYRENQESIANLKLMLEASEKNWSKALEEYHPSQVSNNQLIRLVRLQDTIFCHRANNPQIFNWFYGIFQKNNEILMNELANDLVNEAKERINNRRK